MSKSLYERLGGTEGITAIAGDLVDNHLSNSVIATRFKESKMDTSTLKNAAATFFISGTGGPDIYQGKDLLAAHGTLGSRNSSMLKRCPGQKRDACLSGK